MEQKCPNKKVNKKIKHIVKIDIAQDQEKCRLSVEHAKNRILAEKSQIILLKHPNLVSQSSITQEDTLATTN